MLLRGHSDYDAREGTSFTCHGKVRTLRVRSFGLASGEMYSQLEVCPAYFNS